jgi:hypothetical protein
MILFLSAMVSTALYWACFVTRGWTLPRLARPVIWSRNITTAVARSLASYLSTTHCEALQGTLPADDGALRGLAARDGGQHLRLRKSDLLRRTGCRRTAAFEICADLGQIRQTRDRKSVCLVSRTFRDLMAPILWERFESNLLTDDPQLFEALVGHHSNILANVKEFELLDGPNSEDQLSDV